MLSRLLCKIRAHKYYPVGKINGLQIIACGRCGKTVINDD